MGRLAGYRFSGQEQDALDGRAVDFGRSFGPRTVLQPVEVLCAIATMPEVHGRTTDVKEPRGLRGAVTLDDLLVSTVGARLRLVILDACRNNPLARSMQRTVASRSVSGGSFGQLDENLLGDETLVAYEAAAGTTAADGTGRNSPYTTALLAHLDQPLEILTLFRRVRARVLEATNGEQRPHEYQSLLREHYLSGAPAVEALTVEAAAPDVADVDVGELGVSQLRCTGGARRGRRAVGAWPTVQRRSRRRRTRLRRGGVVVPTSGPTGPLRGAGIPGLHVGERSRCGAGRDGSRAVVSPLSGTGTRPWAEQPRGHVPRRSRRAAGRRRSPLVDPTVCRAGQCTCAEQPRLLALRRSRGGAKLRGGREVVPRGCRAGQGTSTVQPWLHVRERSWRR